MKKKTILKEDVDMQEKYIHHNNKVTMIVVIEIILFKQIENTPSKTKKESN